jgi:hypothetical protein
MIAAGWTAILSLVFCRPNPHVSGYRPEEKWMGLALDFCDDLLYAVPRLFGCRFSAMRSRLGYSFGPFCCLFRAAASLSRRLLAAMHCYLRCFYRSVSSLLRCFFGNAARFLCRLANIGDHILRKPECARRKKCHEDREQSNFHFPSSFSSHFHHAAFQDQLVTTSE